MKFFHYLPLVSLFVDRVLSELETSTEAKTTCAPYSAVTTAGQLAWAGKQLMEPEDLQPARLQLRHPLTLTRLVKSLSDEFTPQMLQEQVITLEKRRRPVTLIGIKKHGWFPHEKINLQHSESRESDVAELMSPYNDIGPFWNDE